RSSHAGSFAGSCHALAARRSRARLPWKSAPRDRRIDPMQTRPALLVAAVLLLAGCPQQPSALPVGTPPPVATAAPPASFAGEKGPSLLSGWVYLGYRFLILQTSDRLTFPDLQKVEEPGRGDGEAH